MNGAEFDWSKIAEDPIAARFGVYVRFRPRDKAPTGESLRIARPMYIDAVCLVVPIQLGGDSRYPGEAWLANVSAGKAVFGETWVAAGDVEVMVKETVAWLRGGIHA